MSYAVIKLAGKQYKISEGEELEVDRLSGEKGAKLTVPEVILISDGETTTVGNPLVAGAGVQLEVLEHLRGEKIRVQKFKAKARYRRSMGFRADLTKVRVNKINFPKATPSKEKKTRRKKGV